MRMSSNDEAVVATGDSFWDVGCYKRTVTRAEDGAKLCSEFMTLIQERAEIEKHYVKSLKAWSHKWNDSIAKGEMLGTACRCDSLSDYGWTLVYLDNTATW